MSILGNHIYPKPIKTWVKAAPAISTFLFLGILFPVGLYTTLYHPHERIEKFHFRSGKFDRMVRKRDEVLRNNYKKAIDWNPNQMKVFNKRPIIRF